MTSPSEWKASGSGTGCRCSAGGGARAAGCTRSPTAVHHRERAALLPEIEEFTELGAWLDQPIRTYSTGMLARLGFGVGACIRSDVVLIDEALSVGDLAFQNKSLARIKTMHEQGAAILLVTHSL